MRRGSCLVIVTLLHGAVTATGALRQPELSAEVRQSVDSAITAAFSDLLALPRDTDAADLGKWVLDSSTTLAPHAPPRQWVIAAQQLIDTGAPLKLNEEMLRQPPGASARQLADSVLAMQRLEKDISKLDAESRLEVVIEINADDVTASENAAGRSVLFEPAIRGLVSARHARGSWRKSTDAELEIEVERWAPATLLVSFAAPRPPRTTGDNAIYNVVVRARGNDQMLERLISRTQWQALAALIAPPR